MVSLGTRLAHPRQLVIACMHAPCRKRLSLSHVRTLKMSEDVLVVKYTPDQRLLAVALLDCTVKVFFSDTLKVRFMYS